MTPGEQSDDPGGGRGEGWIERPRGRRTVIGATTVLAGILIFFAVGAAAQGVYLAAGFMALMGVTIGVLPLGRTNEPRPPRLWTEPTDPVEPPAPGTGTRVLLPVRPHRVVTLAAWAVLGLVLVVSAVGMGIEDVAAGEPGSAATGLVPLGIGGLMLLGSYAGTRNRLAPNQGLLLRPDAVVVRTEAEPVVVPWETLGAVRAHWTRGLTGTDRRRGARGGAVNNWLSLETTLELDSEETTGMSVLAGTRAPTIDVDVLAVDRATVRQLCELYRDHPGRRPELATEAGLRGVVAWEAPRGS